MEMTPFFFGLYKFVKYGVLPLTWIVALFGMALLLAWLPYSPHRQRWLRLATTMGFLLLLLISAPIISGSFMSILEGWSPPVASFSGPYDAIVVLGGGIKEKGTLRPAIELSDESRRRATCGADLFHQGLATTVLMTGGDARIFGVGPMEAPAMKEWAVRMGVPAGNILTENQAQTTYENALGSKRVLGKV